MKYTDIETIESYGRELKDLSQQLNYIDNRVKNIIQFLNEQGVDDCSIGERLNHKTALKEISESLNAILNDLIEMGELINAESQMNVVYASPEFMGGTGKLEK